MFFGSEISVNILKFYIGDFKIIGSKIVNFEGPPIIGRCVFGPRIRLERKCPYFLLEKFWPIV
jgi:hypothetical protein